MYLRGPSTDELLGCAAIVAGFFMDLDALLFWAIPKFWGWVAPWLHAVTA